MIISRKAALDLAILIDDYNMDIMSIDPDDIKQLPGLDKPLIKRLDNLHIETRPISPEQETKFLYYNMAVDDCLKVVRAYLESVAK